MCVDCGMRICVSRLRLVDVAAQTHVERVDKDFKARANRVDAQRRRVEGGEQPDANFVHHLRTCKR
eukprot:522093-Pleurochrysis_carterae.AAC.1